LKPKERACEPQTLGEHLKKRRRLLGLSQKRAGDRLKVSGLTVLNWEKGRTEPPYESIAAIIGFLGYDPFPGAATLSELLRATRRIMGWSIKEAARHLGVDAGTWAQWERTGIPWKRNQLMVRTFLTTLGTAKPGDAKKSG
jgi:transcriptional regulator with XRE-family HTH domain